MKLNRTELEKMFPESNLELFSLEKFRCNVETPIHIVIQHENGGEEIVTCELTQTINDLIRKSRNEIIDKLCGMEIEVDEENVVNILMKSDLGKWHISEFHPEEKHYASLCLEDIAQAIAQSDCLTLEVKNER